MTQVGDVTSQERGSGARFNSGKPRLDLLPGWALDRIVDQLYQEDLISMERVTEVGWLTAMWDGFIEPRIALERAMATVTVEEMLGAARVFEFGAGKYAPWNWAKGMPWSVPFACYMRHTLLCNEDLPDAESGQPHRHHAVCNLIMLQHFIDYCPDMNDIPAELSAEFHRGQEQEDEEAAKGPARVMEEIDEVIESGRFIIGHQLAASEWDGGMLFVRYSTKDGRGHQVKVDDLPTPVLNDLVEIAVGEQESRERILRATGQLRGGY